jgi:hypothetical protein
MIDRLGLGCMMRDVGGVRRLMGLVQMIVHFMALSDLYWGGISHVIRGGLVAFVEVDGLRCPPMQLGVGWTSCHRGLDYRLQLLWSIQ